MHCCGTNKPNNKSAGWPSGLSKSTPLSSFIKQPETKELDDVELKFSGSNKIRPWGSATPWPNPVDPSRSRSMR